MKNKETFAKKMKNIIPHKHSTLVFMILVIGLLIVGYGVHLKQNLEQNASVSQNSMSPLVAAHGSAILSTEQAMLTNIKQNGYNLQTNGLYINWVYGTNPLQTNFHVVGVSPSKPRNE